MKSELPSRRKFIKLASAAGLPITGISAASANKKSTLALPEKENLCFLFQDDSITDGNRARNKDPDHILGLGYCFAISNRIGTDFPQHVQLGLDKRRRQTAFNITE